MPGPFPIRTRLTLLYTGLLFGALAVLGAAATTLFRKRLIDEVQASLQYRIQGVEAFVRRETTAQTAQLIPEELAEFASTQPEGRFLAVRDDEGRSVLAGDTMPPPFLTGENSFTLYGRKYNVSAMASLAPAEAAAGELRRLLLGLAPVLLLVTAGIGFWVSSRA